MMNNSSFVKYKASFLHFSYLKFHIKKLKKKECPTIKLKGTL